MPNANGKAPGSPETSIGWRVSVYWPSLDKTFTGIVLSYDSTNETHTVRWDDAPEDQSGLTEVDLSEGEVAWTESPNVAPTPPGVEPLEELEARLTVGTIKWCCVKVLKAAGVEGMTLAEMVKTSGDLGLKDWSNVAQKTNTINACVASDKAFVKIVPGRVGLACLGAVPWSAEKAAEMGAQLRRPNGSGPASGKKRKSNAAAAPIGDLADTSAFDVAAGHTIGGVRVTPATAAAAIAKPPPQVSIKSSGQGSTPGGKRTIGGNVPGEAKTLVCVKCGLGPMNPVGMRMHNARWCKKKDGPDLYGGNAPDADPVSDDDEEEEANADLDEMYLAAIAGGLTKKQKTTPTPSSAGRGGRPKTPKGDDPGKTIVCDRCGLGPFNSMGINMHNARWCKGPGGAGADGKTREAMKASLHGLKRDKPKAEASHAEQQAAERAKQEAMSMDNGGASEPAKRGPGRPRKNPAASPTATPAPAPASASPPEAASPKPAAPAAAPKPAEPPAPPAPPEPPTPPEPPRELRLDVEVYKQDKTFVAKAPLSVRLDVTLGALKEAIALNTKGALPPHRQRLEYKERPIDAPDEVMLTGVIGVPEGDHVVLKLTIMDERPGEK